MAYQVLTKEEWTRVDGLMQSLYGREAYNHESHVIRELFNVHNVCYPNAMEHSTSCGGCRARVYSRMVTFWLENKDTYK